MNNTHLFKTGLFFIVFIFLLSGVYAQNLNPFTMNVGEEEYTVTKDIDPMFIGTYTANTEEDLKQYPIVLDSDSDFEWGAAVNEEGELSPIDIMEYAKGKMISYIAYVVYFNNKSTGEKGEFMLYELDGNKFLGRAKKEESVAENR